MKRGIAVTAGVLIWQCLAIGVAAAQAGTACPVGEKFVDGVNKVITNDRAGRIYTTGEYGIFVSCDNGETWRKSDTVRRVPGELAVDRANPQFVYYTSGNYFYRSDNYGASFVQVGDGQIEGTGISALRIRQDGAVLAGTSAGAYLSTDHGSNWQTIPGTSLDTLLTDFHDDDGNANVLHIGTHGQGIYSTTDGGQTWMQSDPTFSGWHIVELEVDPQNPSTLFAVGNNSLWRSVDAGTSWMEVITNTASDLAFDVDEPGRAYLLTYVDGIFGSSDGGSTWELVNPLP